MKGLEKKLKELQKRGYELLKKAMVGKTRIVKSDFVDLVNFLSNDKV